MTFKVEQRKAGRRSGRRCAAPTKRNRKRRKCTRFARIRGSFRANGLLGANEVGWNGRVGRKALKPGTYRLAASAAPGDRRTATFRVRRR